MPRSCVRAASRLPPARAVRRRAIATLALSLLFAGSSRAQPMAQRLRDWGDGERLELLPLRQSSLEVLARSQTTLLLRPQDLTRPATALLLLPPPTLDGRALTRQLRLCRIAPPVRNRGLPCLEELPLDLEARRDRLRLQPRHPLQPAAAYSLTLLLRNPLQQGFHPLRLYGLSPERVEPEYLGTWLLQTDTQTE